MDIPGRPLTRILRSQEVGSVEPIRIPTLTPENATRARMGLRLRDAPAVQRVLARLFGAGVDIVDISICWPWPGAKNGLGYGRCGATGEVYVHRVMYAACIGPIPEGLDVEHRCHFDDPTCQEGDTCPHRACCNPHHLDAVTRAENHRRRRLDVQGLTCRSGRHPYEPHRNGTRGCRLCYNESAKAATQRWRLRQAAAGKPQTLRSGLTDVSGPWPPGTVQRTGGRRSGEVTEFDVFVRGVKAGRVVRTVGREGSLWQAWTVGGVEVLVLAGQRGKAYQALAAVVLNTPVS
jgi:HNH endonuclease